MDNIKAVCNWTRVGGHEWPKVIQTQFVDDEIIKPETDELLKDEKAVLLRRKMRVDNDPETGNCELELSLCPRFKISALTMICTAPKLEIFIGAQNEYYETEHGCLLDDCQADEPHSDVVDLRSYRYDIEIEKSGITELSMKLLTTNDEICIFAILLQVAPNPNGVTTSLPNAINLENVQKMLESSNQKLTPNAEKCKQFLQMFGKATSGQTGFPTTTPTVKAMATSNLHKATEIATMDAIFNKLKAHFDERFTEFEAKIEARLNAFEIQQTAKLDEILKALQTMK